MKKIILLSLVCTIPFLINAQSGPDDDKNVVISLSKLEFKFVKGTAEHPVLIKEESRKTYACNSFRTDVVVAEFYNDIETVDDVDIEVDGSKKHGIKPKYEYYNSDGIFYSDAHVCFFQLPLVKKGSTSKVTLKKTTLDPRYFTSIQFVDSKEILEQEVKIFVPSWMELEIKGYNLEKFNIKKNISKEGDGSVYTYTMTNLPAMKNEPDAPGPSYFAPHLLILCKSAAPNNEQIVYFNTLKEQYKWYRDLVLQIGNDEPMVKEKTAEIVKGLTNEEEKVKAVFQWVQDNVRYIAFENGLAGFKPEKAQEVLRKKYGDCKGMANLMTVMLQSLGLDARRCWIGTRHIAYDYSTPSLQVDNHMICAWMNKGKLVYLDATEKYIGFGEIAERIQGRQTLIENGKDYLLERVPEATYQQNTATESRKFTIDGNNLIGHVVQTWKGENKVWLLDGINSIKQEKQENALKQFLAEGKQNFTISNLKIGNINNYNADLKVEYDVVWKDGLTTFDKESYLDADNRRNLDNFKFNIEKRKLPYWFNFKNNLVFETEIQLPAGKTVTTMPEKLAVNQPGYSFTASYNNIAGKLIYKNEIILNQSQITPETFVQWNKDIEQLTAFYNQQIVLTDKN
jgi:hypothetical protein